MSTNRTFWLVGLGTIVFAAILAFFSYGVDVSVLNPKGIVALKQKNLIIITVLLMMIVVIPVYVLTFVMAWRYRASNTDAPYTPEHDSDYRIEAIWWSIPICIIGVLAVITWNSTHDLDPYRPIETSGYPLRVQVIALNWKWLFLYPDQGIATVNYLHIPVGVPVEFDITADAPMNSFWIPSLGSQIYAMPGMKSTLYLRADVAGTYRGLSSNFSGTGFSGMRFAVRAVPQDQFDEWIRASQERSATALDREEYEQLAKPSQDVAPELYRLINPALYNEVVHKYMSAPTTHGH